MGIIGQVFEVSIDLEPMLCVLGWIEGEGKLGDTQLAILRCLFQARRLIAQKWQFTIPPSSREWEQVMNVVMLKERTSYIRQGALKKFNKIWEMWGEKGKGKGIYINSQKDAKLERG